MKDWVLSQEGDRWSVKFDVRDLGGHLDTTFRLWSSTLAARVRLVISRLVLIFVLPLDFHGRVRVVWSMYLPAAFHGIEASYLLLGVFGSFVLLCVGWCGLVVSHLLVLALFLAFWMGPLVVTLLFALFGLGFDCFGVILPCGLLRLVVFTAFWTWWGIGVLGMVLFIFFLLALQRLAFSGILMPWLGLGPGLPLLSNLALS